VVVDNRNETRQFLASRRARITPQQAGLPAYGGNRLGYADRLELLASWAATLDQVEQTATAQAPDQA
jgi:hypothetical protein